jgi:septum formation protein
MDKAGAYGIQGMFSRWVTGVEGDYSNVVGLPVARVCAMLKRAGII